MVLPSAPLDAVLAWIAHRCRHMDVAGTFALLWAGPLLWFGLAFCVGGASIFVLRMCFNVALVLLLSCSLVCVFSCSLVYIVVLVLFLFVLPCMRPVLGAMLALFFCPLILLFLCL